MRQERLIILAALEVEARAAAGALSIPFVRGEVLKSLPPRPPVEIYTIGIRAVQLAEVLSLLAQSSPLPGCRVLLVGLAGALNPSLRIGDLVLDLPEGVARPISGPAPADPAMRIGRIYTADRIVATTTEKKALFEETGALAVDMEQSLVRQAFAPMGLSVIGLRAISDTAAMSLPPVLPHLVDALGRPNPTALLAHMLRRPALAVSLARLGFASSRATRSLTAGIRRLFPQEGFP